MRRKNLAEAPCPIARTLECVGEWWSLLIIRDALQGLRRFDEFQHSLSIAPAMLTRRLNTLVTHGLLVKQQYSVRPPRYEYHLTERGRDLSPVLLTMLAWGNKHMTPEGESVLLQDRETNHIVDPVVVDKYTGLVISTQQHRLIPGPAATGFMKRRLQHAQRHRELGDRQTSSPTSLHTEDENI